MIALAANKSWMTINGRVKTARYIYAILNRTLANFCIDDVFLLDI